jgi:hypothetical protein
LNIINFQKDDKGEANMLKEELVRDICEQYLNEAINEVGGIRYGYEDDDEPDYSHMIITFYGGDNSDTGDKGKWARYLTVIKELVEKLETEFDNVWLVDLDVDCPDDVFSIHIAVRTKEDEGELDG